MRRAEIFPISDGADAMSNSMDFSPPALFPTEQKSTCPLSHYFFKDYGALSNDHDLLRGHGDGDIRQSGL